MPHASRLVAQRLTRAPFFELRGVQPAIRGHGAAPTSAMTHIAIQEALNGKVVDWMEKVTAEQYSGPRDEQ